MPTPLQLVDIASRTAETLHDAIKAQTAEVLSGNLNGASKAAALADLARAYRHLVGGAQPGNIVVEK